MFHVQTRIGYRTCKFRIGHKRDADQNHHNLNAITTDLCKWANADVITIISVVNNMYAIIDLDISGSAYSCETFVINTNYT